MEYRTAKNIRSRKLSDIITDNLLYSNKGVASSFGGAVKEKLAATGTGIMEKFDPLNIAKFLTFGSRLAPALLGRATGRSQESIEYFSRGRGKKGNTTDAFYSHINPNRIVPLRMNDGLADILAKMYGFMRKSYEHQILQDDLLNDMRTERKKEDEIRHGELIEAIGNINVGKVTAVAKEKKDDWLGNIMGWLMDKLKQLKDWFLGKLGWVKTLLSSLVSAWEWFKNLGVIKWLLTLGEKAFEWLARLVTAGSLTGLISLLMSAGLTAAIFSAIDRLAKAPAEEANKIMDDIEKTYGLKTIKNEKGFTESYSVNGKQYTLQNLPQEYKDIINAYGPDDKRNKTARDAIARIETARKENLDTYAPERLKEKYGGTATKTEATAPSTATPVTPKADQESGVQTIEVVGRKGAATTVPPPNSPVFGLTMDNIVNLLDEDDADFLSKPNVFNNTSSHQIKEPPVNTTPAAQRDRTPSLDRVLGTNNPFLLGN